MYLPIQSERLYEQIVTQIEARIMTGELKVGDQLPAERDLADQFSVSRTAVREAVKALHQKGLIEIRPGRGTFVTNGTQGAMRHSLGLLMHFGAADGLTDLTEVREILEPEIAARAAVRITEEYILAMQQAVATMEAAVSAENSEIFVEADLDFHLALAEATQNAVIPVLMDSIIDLLREQRKRTGLVTGGLWRGQSHHKRILEAIICHDPEAARAAMKDHLQQVREDANGPLPK